MLEAALDRSQKIHTQYLTSLTGALLGETLAPRDPKRALDVAESALGVARACGHRAVEAELLRVRAASLVNVDCEAAETANKKAMSLRSGWVLALSRVTAADFRRHRRRERRRDEGRRTS